MTTSTNSWLRLLIASWRALGPVAATLLVVGLLAQPTPVGAAQVTQPLLVLEPDRGLCSTLVTARGAGFPAGASLRLLSVRGGGHNAAEIASTTVAHDGTFARPLPFVGFECDQTTPEGTRFVITAVATPGGSRPGPDDMQAQATFTVTANPARCFPETGYCVQGRFLQYWEQHGLDLGDPGISFRESLALFGYPISEEFSQTLEDGKPYTVQYFERARLEYHPENWLPYDVLLGHFGRRFHPVDPPARPEPGARYFPEMGHNVGGSLLDYWQRNGGLMQFGYPLSEPFYERLEDGSPYLVQYFERARLEVHPENRPPYDILLGHFGRRVLAETRAAAAPV